MTDLCDNVHQFAPTATSKPRRRQQSATVLQLPPPAEPQTMIEREQKSQIIKAAVTYCCSKGTFEAGFEADHTGEWLFAGAGGIVGDAHFNRANRSLRQLIAMMKRPDEPMTVELWSLATARDKFGEAADAAKEAAGGTLEQVQSRAREQQQNGAEFVERLAGNLRQAAGAFESDVPFAARGIKSAADYVEDAAAKIRDGSFRDLVDGATDFAKRQPAAFKSAWVVPARRLGIMTKSQSAPPPTRAAESGFSRAAAIKLSKKPVRASFTI